MEKIKILDKPIAKINYIDKYIFVIFAILSALTPYGIRVIKYFLSDTSVSFLVSCNDLFAFCFGIIIVILAETKNINKIYKKYLTIINIGLVVFAFLSGLCLYESYQKEIKKKEIENQYVEYRVNNDSLGAEAMILEIKKCESGNERMFLISIVLSVSAIVGLLLFMFKYRK